MPQINFSPTHTFHFGFKPSDLAFHVGMRVIHPIQLGGDTSYEKQPDEFKGFRASLWKNRNPDTDFKGLELATFGSDSRSVFGAQIGFFSNRVHSGLAGLQLGCINYINKVRVLFVALKTSESFLGWYLGDHETVRQQLFFSEELAPPILKPVETSEQIRAKRLRSI